MELSFCAIIKMWDLLDSHGKMTGTELLAWRVEENSEGLVAWDPSRSVSAADAYVGGIGRPSGFVSGCI